MQANSAVAHLSRRYRFAASHRLHVLAISDEQNRVLFGKCNNPFGHGHNYAVQVTVSGRIHPDTGMVVDLGDLDSFAQREVVDRYDCTNLNAGEGFQAIVPSTENLCLEVWSIFERFAKQHGTVQLRRVRIEETNNNAFDYFGQGRPIPTLEPHPLWKAFQSA